MKELNLTIDGIDIWITKDPFGNKNISFEKDGEILNHNDQKYRYIFKKIHQYKIENNLK